MEKRRPWGNVLLNHIVNHEDPSTAELPTFDDAIGGKCGFAMVWAFVALEMMVLEVDSVQAETLELVIFSTLELDCTEDFMRRFELLLRFVVEQRTPVTVDELLQQVRV
jgi:hypothetical protein